MNSKVLGNKTSFNSDYLGEEIANLLDCTFQIPDSYNAQVMKLNEAYNARPDAFCMDVYGDEDYADLICKLNGISNPMEFCEGMLIVVPDLNELDKFYCHPASSLIENVSVDKIKTQKSIKPVPKSKNSKRKPNEAVIGDKRFNIDTVSKTVIY